MTQIELPTIAAAIRATRMRIQAGEKGNTLLDQLRGVRRTAAHIADLLPSRDQQNFLTACGYGA